MLLGLLLLLSGCTSGPKTGLVQYMSSANPIAARFYYLDETGTIQAEELISARLPLLTDALDEAEFRVHGFHTDYFWFGTFGVELTLDDGTFWIYDGTQMQLRSVSMLESDENDYMLKSTFAEVTSCDFWGVLCNCFSAARRMVYRSGW